MLYFANPTKVAVPAMQRGQLGVITTPKQGNIIPAGAWWCADNGKYGKGWPGYARWWAWLGRTARRYDPTLCWFAVAPDRPMDAAGTLADSLPWLGPIRSLGLPAAFCAQDGSENGLVPWRDLDVLFIAGTTEWKLAEGMELCHEAKRRGKRVHVGRVNSQRRFHHVEAWGADSCDGTYLTFGPTTNLPKLLSWTTSPRQIDVYEAIRAS